MTNRETTLLDGRVKRIEQILGHSMPPTPPPLQPALEPAERAHLREAAEDLYWNELEWEKITGEETLDQEFLTELAFPGFLAFIRGLLLSETMPDSQAPARPSPEVVVDLLEFLALRVVEVEEQKGELDGEDLMHREMELKLTSRLVDLVLYLLHGLDREAVGRVEAALLQE